MEHLFEILLHAVKDTLPLLPWILIIYIILQFLQDKVDLKRTQKLSGTLGPVLGASTGLIPQCGFSVVTAKLFEQKYITLGTLMAVFIATSDEAFILLLSSGSGAVWLLPTIIVKFMAGIVAGYLVDNVLKLFGHRQVCVEMPSAIGTPPTTTRDIFMQQYEKDLYADAPVCSCGQSHGDSSAWKLYGLYPLLHTLKVAGFIFLVNFILTWIIHAVGEQQVAHFMQRSKFFQPFIVSVIGLIPNCASSVVITETFLNGGITFGSFIGGLCANAGLGFVVLLKNTKKWKRNLGVVAFSYFFSVVIGMICNAFV